jgi:hypothetical protein
VNSDLEALLLALDAVIAAQGGEQAEELEAKYESKLEEVLARSPGLSRERLLRAVDFAYKNWQRTRDKKPTSMPPRA